MTLATLMVPLLAPFKTTDLDLDSWWQGVQGLLELVPIWILPASHGLHFAWVCLPEGLEGVDASGHERLQDTSKTC